MRFVSEFSQKSKIIFGIVVLIIVASTIPVFFDNEIQENLTAKFIIIGINVSSLFLLYWITNYTYYKLDNHLLVCKSGPFKKKIVIENIRKIESHDGLIVPALWKLSLSHKGIIIHYNQFDEIYISPKDNQKFLNELLKINPNIIIPTDA